MIKEYPMYSPNAKAKVCKKYTGDVSIKIENDIIKTQKSNYRVIGYIKWVDITDLTGGDEQLIKGDTMSANYITIRTNTLLTINEGDLIVLPDGTKWIVQGTGSAISYINTPKRRQTYQTLPLASTL